MTYELNMYPKTTRNWQNGLSFLPMHADLVALVQGKRIHSYEIRNGFESDVLGGDGLVNLYRKVLSWNATIANYS